MPAPEIAQWGGGGPLRWGLRRKKIGRTRAHDMSRVPSPWKDASFHGFSRKGGWKNKTPPLRFAVGKSCLVVVVVVL